MKREKWVVMAKRADFQRIGEKFHIDPVIARLIRNRDIEKDEEIEKYLNGTLKDLYDPALMKGVREAAALLHEKILQKKKIRIIGDYDIDGVMSAYILSAGLEELGADADVAIPHRILDGYGLSIELVQAALESGADTLLTCDNGIAAFSQIAYAAERGMTVIVTDHHEAPFEEEGGVRTYTLPPAAVVIDPKQEDCPYPFKGICGAVVAMKLLQALFRTFGRSEQEVLEEFLEMAAFATVGDVMDLVDENRILVKYGLRALEHTQNVGLKALLEVCEMEGKRLSAYHIGFILGPCLNATGRLDSALRALALLQCRDRAEALRIAVDLRHMNESRKEMTKKGVEDAEALIALGHLERRKVLSLYLPGCHESLAGIIAGRIREKYEKPVFVLTDGEEGLKGSGRSIPAYSMYEELTRCKDLFTKYGGHKMAAGLSMPRERLADFIRRMEENCTLREEDFVEKICIDAAMPFSYVNQELIRQLAYLEPFGNGNRKPVFAQKGLSLCGHRILGQSRRVGKYTVCDERGDRWELTYFGDQEELLSCWQDRGLLQVTYYPELSVFRGRSEIQFVIQNFG